MADDHPQRRVHGFNDCRYDGLSDLLLRAQGCSFFDVGCNRGHVAYEFYRNGARLVHGCDIDGQSIAIARGWFSELAEVESKFEVVDLEKSGAIEKAFGVDAQYDIVGFVGVYHKLVRVMDKDALSRLVVDLGRRSLRYFAWNGYPDHLPPIDSALRLSGLSRVHTSEMAHPGRFAAVWRRSQCLLGALWSVSEAAPWGPYLGGV